jgi:arginase
MSKNIVFLINKSEITAGTRGASLGPDAILTAARKTGDCLFGEHELHRLPNFNHLLDQCTDFMHAKRIDGVIGIYNQLNTRVSEILERDAFPIILAGDHGSAGGTIAGIRTAFPSKRLGVVWIDAHADIHTPYTTPSGNIHGMPLATALAIDNIECQTNSVDDTTVSKWHDLKHIGGIAPKIKPEDIVYVGVRSVEEQEIKVMERLRIKNIAVKEVRANGVAWVMESIAERLNDCEIIYVSFDVDSMDPKLTSHGTGTPVADGLTPQEARELLTNLASNPKTVCLEVVEVNPCLDEKVNAMAEIAFGLIRDFSNVLKK